MEKLEIGIFGLGITGGSLYRYLKKYTTHTLRRIDPYLGFHDDTAKIDIAFICVPVPTNKDGTQDYTELEKCMEQCPKETEIFVRSTVVPGTCDKYGVVAFPEFLTERRADTDMEKLDLIVGLPYEVGYFKELFSHKNIYWMTNKEAELAKYAHNTLAGIKITFMNTVKEISQLYGLNYESVVDAMLVSRLFSDQHMSVPGPDGNYGFGGKCLPKDMKAFAQRFTTIAGMDLVTQSLIWNNYFRGKNGKDTGNHS